LVFEAETLALAQAVLDACRGRNWKIATAESCTGGLVFSALTAIGGSSDVVERGFVTDSNEAKSELLGVPHCRAGRGQRRNCCGDGAERARPPPADLVVSVTGIAGPGGATRQSR
jgi:nicotinamide-nucleotide amidase